ncbi:MAG TPA: carboxypeptidase-like regulatory domain-containing protein [Candidatus Sulfotelmatobacter sp.]|nr:carboxypeptidase-like regulatory domain-containing protein [Candidatus Sulfotelmatobacter sp.]
MVTQLIVLLAAFMLVPAVAWAVATVNVNVTDDQGHGVPNATVTLGQETKTTDEKGNVTFQTDGGAKDLQVTAKEYRTSHQTVTVPADGTLTVSNPLRPLYPWMAQNPGGWGIGFGGSGTFEGRQQFVVKSFIDKLNIPGQPTQTFVQGSQMLPTLGAQNGYAVDLNGGGVPIVLGGPGLQLPGMFKLFPTAEVKLGGAHADVHVQSTMVPFLVGSNYDLSGTVFTWDASGHLLLQSPWADFGYPYVSVGGGYGSIAETHLNRSDGAPGDYDFGWSKWYWDARAGVSLWDRHLGPFAGIRQTWYSSSVNSHIPIPWTLPGFVGASVDREIGLTANRTEALVGLDARICASLPIFARAEAGISSHSVSFMFKAMLSFDP